MKKRVLAIAPHPDDETLGCGGTILKHKSNGDKIFWVIMTNISKEEGYDENRVKLRQREIGAVSDKYGFSATFKLDFPTKKLDIISRAHLVQTVSSIINKIEPDIIYLPNRSDIHSDHRVTFETVMSSAKTFLPPVVEKILMYEVISETEFAPPLLDNAFVPNCFSDISEFVNKKISIMKIYKGELMKRPFPRSPANIKALASFRGAHAGMRYAEAFMILREVC